MQSDKKDMRDPSGNVPKSKYDIDWNPLGLPQDVWLSLPVEERVSAYKKYHGIKDSPKDTKYGPRGGRFTERISSDGQVRRSYISNISKASTDEEEEALGLWGQMYWMAPDFQEQGEDFFEMPEWLNNFLERKSLFQFLSPEIVQYSLDNRAYFRSERFSIYHPYDGVGNVYEKHDNVSLYLVKGVLKGEQFYKIGLTLLDDPIKRDPKVYKEVIACHSMKGGGRWFLQSLPYLYEAYALWRCWQSERLNRITLNNKNFKRWIGRTEVVETDSPEVKEVFKEACRELDEGLGKFSSFDIYLELSILNDTMVACWDDFYIYSGHAIGYRVLEMLPYFAGTKKSNNIAGLDIGLGPVDIRRAYRLLIEKLAPYVDSHWDRHKVHDRDIRYRISRRKADEWYTRQGGVHDRKYGVSKPRSWWFDEKNPMACSERETIIDFEQNIGRVFKFEP